MTTLNSQAQLPPEAMSSVRDTWSGIGFQPLLHPPCSREGCFEEGAAGWASRRQVRPSCPAWTPASGCPQPQEAGSAGQSSSIVGGSWGKRGLSPHPSEVPHRVNAPYWGPQELRTAGAISGLELSTPGLPQTRLAAPLRVKEGRSKRRWRAVQLLLPAPQGRPPP